MTKSFSRFIDDMSMVILDPEPEFDDNTIVTLSSGDTMLWSAYKKELEALQRIDATFTMPVDSPEFEAWLKVINPVSNGILMPHTAVRKLEANPVLEAQYMKLHSDISYQDFWERYLFRVALLQDRLAAVLSNQPISTSDPVVAHLPLQTPVGQWIPKKERSFYSDDEYTLDTTDFDNVVGYDHGHSSTEGEEKHVSKST